MAKYLSNRQKNLKVGIVSYTESNTVLEVTGKVGIGTTNAISTLSVVGDTNVTGVVTANSFSGSGSALTGIVTYITAGSGISINQNTGNVTITATGGGGGDGGTGVTIQDEGSVVGVADSITTLNFVGANVSATASGSISTITVADNLVGTALSISGISTFTNGPVLVGSSSSTGTASQSLQVTGGAYVSGNTGIRTTNPQSALDVRGAISIGRTDVAGINSIRSVIDINSWEYGGVFKATGTEDATPQDIYFKDDGTKMYILGDSGNEVNEYALSTAWDVSTAGFTTVFSTASQETNPLGLYFKPDGTRMYICGNTAVSPANADQVRSYTLSTPWSIASGSITYDNKAYTTTNTAPQGVYFKDDGLKMYVVDSTFDGIYEYSLSTAWELDSTITLLNSVPLGTANTLNLPLSLTAPTGINFNTSGTKMYITDITRDVVARFDLATPWDTTTISFYDNVYVGFQELAPCGIFYQEDQSKAYIVGTSNDTVYQFNTDVPSLELASSGISTRSSIILNNEARLNNRLYVTGDTHISSNTNVKGSLTVDGSTTIVSNLTVSGGTITAGNVAATLLGNTSTNIVMAGSQTTGTLQIGAAAQTGTMTVGLSTASQTTNIQAGANASGTQKTINLGTGGLAGSRTLITVGSATAGAISTVTIPSPTNLLIGTATTTGTASQPLQVTGGAYVSGSVGIGTTNPLSKLHVEQTTEGEIARFRASDSTRYLTIKSFNSGFNGSGIEFDATSSAGVLRFSTNSIEKVRITTDGNVGIGTDNPQDTLQVNGDLRLQAAIPEIKFRSGGNVNQYYIGANISDSVDGGFIIGEGSGITGGSTRFLIDTNGNVGINSSSPTSRLDVVGNIKLTGAIYGPTELVIDPAAVGDNTGAVRIKGDLYVDGTQTYINSTTIELADFNVGIATTVGTNLLLDGAGIGIGSTNIRKTITWNNTASALTSSEDWNLVSGKQYEINGTSVLSSTTLGSGVVNSSLTSVGTLGQLNVSGVSTFQGNVYLGDADSLYFGNGNDLRILHNGTDSYIVDENQGNLYIGGSNEVIIANAALNETKAKFITNGAVELYYDNTKEFETTGYGATVFGTLQSQGLNVSGVTTSSGGFVGNLTGTATTATNLADAANITTGTINSARLSGTYDINVSYASTAGIATVAQGLTGTPNISVGVVTATSFVKSGGTSSQFLKADGSVDSSTYLASYTETDTLNSVTGRGNSTVNGISIGILTATSGNFSGIVTSSGAVISGATTATSFVKSGGTSSQFLKADGSVDSSTYLTTTGSGTNLTGIVTSITAGTNITISNSTGNVTINAAGGGGGGGSGTFDTGISTSIYISVTSGVGINTTQTNDIFVGPGIAGTTIGIGYSFPSTAGRKYVIESIHVTNTFSNELYLVARHDFSGGSAVPTVQRVVIPYQGSAELLSQPIIANPSDILRFQALSGVGNTAVGIDGGLDAFVVYSTKTDTNYVGTGATVTSSTGTGIFTSTTYPSVIQSIRICNYNLNIDVDASISIYRGTVSAGVRLGYLVYNMTIPKNSVIEILEKPKYLATNDTIVAVGSTTNSLGVTVSGKYIV